MAKPTSRLAGRLVGGLLVGTLGAIVWAARRQQSTSAEPAPPPATPPPAPVRPPDLPPDAQPTTRRTTARPNVRAFLGAAVSIGIAGAVALTPVVARAGAWRLPLAIAGGVLLLAGCVFVFPRVLAPRRVPEDLVGVEGLSAKDRIQFADDSRKLQNDVRASLLQAVAGGAVLIGVLFTWQQQQATLRQQEATSRQIADQLAITRQGQVGERFSRGVGQLGSDSIDVRLGGLYELEQLAHQASERRLVIVEVVAAFIRQHARPATSATALRPPPQDVAAALTIIGRRSIGKDDPPVNLQGVKFGRVELGAAVLRGANLGGADLSGASLLGADLRAAGLRFADLRGADLGAVDLRGATLIGADLRGATLIKVDLRGADLRLADLRGIDLADQQLDLRGAKADQSTRWPEGFDWRAAGVEQQA
jgi:hypothetical protein